MAALAIACVAAPLMSPDGRRWLEEFFIGPEELLEATPWTFDESRKTSEADLKNLGPILAKREDVMREGAGGASKVMRGSYDFVLSREGKEILKIRGHDGTPFLLSRDGRQILVSTHRRMATGTTIASFDSRTGKKRWEAQ
ncbi:MAG: hypothetical protein AAF488_13140, partial [Planctomycetota bacterium]